MGNSFIGFPVPRAKIADMIATDAPPTLHKENHESGGKDELDCTGLVGAGGGGIPFKDFLVQIATDNQDRFYLENGGSGNATNATDGFRIYTGATQDSYAALYKDLFDALSPLSFTKQMKGLAHVNLKSLVNNVCDFWFCCGWPASLPHIGFKATDGKLYGTLYDGALHYTTEYIDLGASAYEVNKIVRWELTPGDKVEFYVDGVKLGELSAASLSGSPHGHIYLMIYITNPGSTNNKQARVPYMSFWQEA